jgi:inosine-uridine nucleoside N-ribohydrolase
MPTIVLDCDPGHDDALAMMLAAADPAVELLAISTVAGNQTLEKTTLNARRVCDIAGITGVPVVAGLPGTGIVAADVHGESGIDGPRFGPVRTPLTSTDAVGYLAGLLRSRPEPVTVVATGPLTNVAALLATAPATVERVVFMGGSTGNGNVTPYAEFNVFADPEAADAVVRSGVPVTMVGLDVTHQALADDDVCARIAAIGSPLATTCVELPRAGPDTRADRPHQTGRRADRHVHPGCDSRRQIPQDRAAGQRARGRRAGRASVLGPDDRCDSGTFRTLTSQVRRCDDPGWRVTVVVDRYPRSREGIPL